MRDVRQTERVTSAIQLIYDALLRPPSAVVQALAGVAHATHAERALFRGLDLDRKRPIVACGFGFDEVMLERFNNFEQRMGSSAALQLGIPVGGVQRRSDAVSTRQLRRSAIFAEVVRPNGDTLDAMATSIARSSTQWVDLGVDRYRGSPDFSSQDVRAMQVLGAHWNNFWRLHQLLGETLVARECNAQALETLRCAVLCLDETGKPVYINRRAQQLAESKDGLVIDSRGISTRDPVSARLLHASLRSALNLYRSAGSGPSLADARRVGIRRTSSNALLRASVMPVPADSALLRMAGGPLALVCITDPETLPDSDHRRWAGEFGFAPREAELACHLVRGTSLSDAASLMHIGLGTIRWYRNRLFEKTGTHRQAELVSLLLRHSS